MVFKVVVPALAAALKSIVVATVDFLSWITVIVGVGSSSSLAAASLLLASLLNCTVGAAVMSVMLYNSSVFVPAAAFTKEPSLKFIVSFVPPDPPS